MKIRDLLENLTVTSNAIALMDLPHTASDKGRVFKLFDVLAYEKQIVVEKYELLSDLKIDRAILLGTANEEQANEYLTSLSLYCAYDKLDEFMDREIKSFNAMEKIEFQDTLSKLSEHFVQRSNQYQDMAEAKVHPKDIDASAERYSAHFLRFKKFSANLHAKRFGGDPTIPDDEIEEIERSGYIHGLESANQQRADCNENVSAYDQMISHLSTIAERAGISIVSRFERGDD